MNEKYLLILFKLENNFLNNFIMNLTSNIAKESSVHYNNSLFSKKKIFLFTFYLDAAAVWMNPKQYMDYSDTKFGTTNAEV